MKNTRFLSAFLPMLLSASVLALTACTTSSGTPSPPSPVAAPAAASDASAPAFPRGDAATSPTTAMIGGDDGPAYGPELQGFDYPYPVHRFRFESQGQPLQMAYMDVAANPAKANGRTAVLLHGKNFCAATWGPTIKILSDAGYRVVAVDQIGWCKSTKPERYQYSFQQLARNTNALLASIGVHEETVIGHSTGGMLGIRYALMYPKQTQQLVLVDPIGLEDWEAKGVPPPSVDQWYARDLQTTATRLRNYERSTYYAGQWRADYEPWVQMLAGMYRGPGKRIVAWNSALIYDMIFTEPVYYRLHDLKPPVLLFIGDKDTTAIASDFAPPAVKATLGHYATLGREAAKIIPNVKLVEFPDFGHAPQMQDPAAFHAALLQGMAAIDTARQ